MSKVKINESYTIEYKNGYFIVHEHAVSEKGNEYTKPAKTYPSLEAMILYAGIDMSYHDGELCMKAKEEYLAEWNRRHLEAKRKIEQNKLKG